MRSDVPLGARPGTAEADVRPLRIALSKGRIFDETLPLFAAAGIRPAEDPDTSRKLIIRCDVDADERAAGGPTDGSPTDGSPTDGGPTDGGPTDGGPVAGDPVEFLIVRASDVPTYVQHGGAHAGVVGKDVLMEHGGEGLLEPLDLGIARCRLMVAGYPDADLDSRRRFRVATKYADCARRHFAAHHRQVEIIKLYGSMELAPLVGLGDLIVDVVDSGATLRANGLAPLEHIADISARLIVNRASMKIRHRRVEALVRRLGDAVAAAAAPRDPSTSRSASPGIASPGSTRPGSTRPGPSGSDPIGPGPTSLRP